MEQLLKHTMLWHLGLPENIKGSFGVGACPATAGAVILQSAQFMNCFQVFFGRRNGSQVVVLLPCAAPAGKKWGGWENKACPQLRCYYSLPFWGAQSSHQ